MTAPDGTTWTVRRRRQPVDDAEDEHADGGEGEDEDGEDVGHAEWVLGAIAVAVVVGGTLVDPRIGLAFFLLEVVLALLGGVVWLRRRHGRPWYIEASASSFEPDLRWEVRGRHRSRVVVDEVALALERGHLDVHPVGTTRL